MAFRCSSTSATGKVSFPAGTGVCVVKTVERAATSAAVSRSRPLLFRKVLDAGDGQECRVPFIHVAHRRFQPRRNERAESTHGQQQLLAETHEVVATIKTGGQLAIVRRVLRHVRVQQVEPDAPHREHPHPGVALTIRKRHGKSAPARHPPRAPV